MRVLLVPVADRPECAIALATAFDLGQRLGANIHGCHIRPHRDSSIALPSELQPLMSDEAAWQSAFQGSKTRKSGASAKALFSSIAMHHNFPLTKKPTSAPGSVWLEKVGSPDKVLSILGPVSDMSIVSRPASGGGKIAGMFMLAALMNSARPVLILPQSGQHRVGRRICIAWNQSAEAARAVAAAMPLIQLADKVTIVTCGSETGVGPKSGQLASYLGFWGVKAERARVRDKNQAKALIKGYKESKSDLLVMGAYSRSRLRQQIFGGVTDYMLKQANIPVFMLHT